jgi:hypothetical protein
LPKLVSVTLFFYHPINLYPGLVVKVNVFVVSLSQIVSIEFPLKVPADDYPVAG